MDPDQRIARRSAQGAGVFRREEALDAGLSPRQIRQRVQSGRWVQIRPGVFLIAGVAPSPHITLAAAVAATKGTASHRSAGALQQLLGHHPDIPEVTVETDTGHHHEHVRLHRTADLLPSDVQYVDGIRCTNAVRSVIDLGARLTESELLVVTDRAIHRRLVHPDRLTTRFLQLARPGRDGIAAIRGVLMQLDPSLAPAESDLESLLFSLLRRAGLELPVRQHRVQVDGHVYRLDLAYPGRMLAIECDGFTHHGTRPAFESDRARQNRLVTAGWTVLRFTWQQIVREPEVVLATIRRALSRPAA